MTIITILQIWDTAGQERFRTITSAYYRGANGIILCYDVTNCESFEHIVDWINEVNKYAPEKVCMLLVGNKSDRAEKVVSTEKAKKFADSFNIPFIECSAKNNNNIEAAFQKLATDLVNLKDNGEGQNDSSDNKKIKNSIKLQQFVSQFNSCC